jgi:hypothetical protein
MAAFPEGSRKDSFHRLSREIPIANELAAVLGARQMALRVDGCRCAIDSRGGSRVRVPRGIPRSIKWLIK